MAVWITLAVAGLVGADQLIKWWALETVKPAGSIPVIEGVFHFQYVENRGAGFGILENQRWIFIILTVALVALAVWLLISRRVKGFVMVTPVTLIIAGGLGNLIDRIFRGFVVDMLYVKLIDFPVFNFADVCVVVGCLWLIAALLFRPELFSGLWKKEPDGETEERSGDGNSD